MARGKAKTKVIKLDANWQAFALKGRDLLVG
jgi:hypothetical protein